eukprot:scaffold2217_cov132-Isochrysis_galbana.AAC.10
MYARRTAPRPSLSLLRFASLLASLRAPPLAPLSSIDALHARARVPRSITLTIHHSTPADDIRHHTPPALPIDFVRIHNHAHTFFRDVLTSCSTLDAVRAARRRVGVGLALGPPVIAACLLGVTRASTF